MDFCVFLFFFGIEVSIKEIVMREREGSKELRSSATRCRVRCKIKSGTHTIGPRFTPFFTRSGMDYLDFFYFWFILIYFIYFLYLQFGQIIFHLLFYNGVLAYLAIWDGFVMCLNFDFLIW